MHGRRTHAIQPRYLAVPHQLNLKTARNIALQIPQVILLLKKLICLFVLPEKILVKDFM